ncbi:MAG: glycyl-radical enzyme activating protein [Candidatus Cyclobacteriaceae bacterium M3_2C_046]
MKEEGIVFDIQRHALNDGPGIRTTVFLKGCPLRCVWCHNPEAQSFKPQLSYSSNQCQNCFTCLTICKNQAHQVVNDQHCLDVEKCEADGYCVRNCPFEAVEIIGKSMTVDQVMEVVRKDQDYYIQSGGGVTLSGGEPMSQFAFTYHLLKSAKQENMHTCLDTSGYARPDQFEKILPFVDLFLFDYKETDPNRHHEFTGVNQQLILRNLDLIIKNKAKVRLRCPVVPGFNDSDQHLKGIALLSQKYQIPVDLMPFHNMAKGKAERLGLDSFVLPEIAAVKPEEEEKWLKLLKSYGCLINQ